MAAEVSRDEILTNFQACTGIDDVEVALVHLEENNWDLITAVNRVLPQDTQTLPSERSLAGPTLFRNLRREYSDMDHDSLDLDTSRMEDDEEVVLIPPPHVPNGVIREARKGTSTSSKSKSTNPPPASLFSLKKETHNNKSSSSSSSNSHAKVSLSSDFMMSGPSGSKKGGSNREVRFIVRYNLTGEVLNVSLAECETIDTLKTLIHAHFEVPPCQQKLRGWPKSDPSDGAKLGSLSLPEEVNLVLSTSNGSVMDFAPGTSGSSVDKDKYTLIIHDETRSDTHTIDYPGSKTVRGVKEDLSSVTDIPVRFQVWTGWPSGTTDTTILSNCGLDRPQHNLFIKKQISAPSSSADLSKKMMELGDGSETSSDVEDLTESYPLEEDFFAPEVSTSSQRHLIPDNAPDEVVGTIQFTDNFLARYGSCHPMFFHGTLEEAVKEACIQPAKNRKLLAIYLHHDGSVVSNVFCQHILCNESIVSYLTMNFVVWGWDATNESNRQLLLAAANKNFGPPGVGTIRNIEREKYPAIIIVSRIRATTEICNVIYGPSAATVDELMGNLMNTTEMYNNQRAGDVREEDEREARELVKREQDEAYEASLVADRAKDEAKRALEQQKLNEEMKQQEAEHQAKMLREHIASTLPPEPEANCADPVCSLKCRVPGGKVISRRFLQTTTLNVLFDFLFTQGFSRDEYKFLTTYPKRDLADLPPTTVMKGLFSTQDTLIVEER